MYVSASFHFCTNGAHAVIWTKYVNLRGKNGNTPFLSCYLYERECFQLHLNAIKLRSDQCISPERRSCTYFVILFATVSSLLLCRLGFHSAAPCQKQTEPPWDLGKKSTMSRMVDLIRITRLVRRSSARNCNLRRLSGRGRIHRVSPTSRHLKTIKNLTTHRAFV